MKQIRFKNQMYKITACWDCPILNEDYGFCQEGACIKHPIEEGVFPDDCPLEVYDLALSIKQTNDSIKFVE